MKIVADLHLHSKYSRAVSQQMVIPEMAKWAKKKGIGLLGTGDFTHPLWFRELKSQLEETSEGIYKLKMNSLDSSRGVGLVQGKPFDSFPHQTVQDSAQGEEESLFLLSTEISSIYSQGGKVRRIHNLIFVPSLEVVEKINAELLRRGANLMADGRPIIGLSARDLAELILAVDESCLIVPAHAWTPWFSLYGSESGFDSIEECFGDMSKNIFAIETGLSSNPEMNWQIAELDNRQIISFSDAHSLPKLGREATVFALSENGIPSFSYQDVRDAIMGKTGKLKISHTIEFYPEEGKYHYTGHRNCQVRQSPEETKKQGTTCPVCGKGLTVGVMHRVEQLARQSAGWRIKAQSDEFGVKWILSEESKKPPYVMLVPLLEILSEAMGSLPSSQRVINEYNNLTDGFDSEFAVLLEIPINELTKVAGEKIAEGVSRVRQGKIVVEPGYDGAFGVVKIWPSDSSPHQTAQGSAQGEVQEEKKDQLSLF